MQKYVNESEIWATGSTQKFPKWENWHIIENMRVIALRTLRSFWELHADAQGPLEAWYDHVRHANWTTPADVQKDYGDDVVRPKNRAVFDIKGNRYRLVVKFEYKFQVAYIRFVGTHAQYDEIDVLTI